MKPTQKQRTFTRNNLAEHNFNYVNRPQTSKSFRPNNHNHLFSQKQNFRQVTTTKVNSHDYPRISQDQSENYPFFQQNRNKEQNQGKHNTLPNYQSSDDDEYYQPDTFAPYTQEYRPKPPRQNQASHKTNFYPQNLANTQNHQPLQTQNPAYTPSYQPI